MTKPQLKALTELALDAFWQVIVEHYPEAQSGDLSPWASVQLDLAAESAVSEWISNNVPDMAAGRQL